jgi:hypothetical protein
MRVIICICISMLGLFPDCAMGQILIDGTDFVSKRNLKSEPPFRYFRDTTVTVSVDGSTSFSLFVYQARLDTRQVPPVGGDVLHFGSFVDCNCDLFENLVKKTISLPLKWQLMPKDNVALHCDILAAQISPNRWVSATIMPTGIGATTCAVDIGILPQGNPPVIDWTKEFPLQGNR